MGFKNILFSVCERGWLDGLSRLKLARTFGPNEAPSFESPKNQSVVVQHGAVRQLTDRLPVALIPWRR